MNRSEITIPAGLSPMLTAPPPSSYASYVNHGPTYHHFDQAGVIRPPPPSQPCAEPVSFANYVTPTTLQKPTPAPRLDTESHVDHTERLVNMKREREGIFQKANVELDLAKRGHASHVPSNKAWEDAWKILRQSMTDM
jgi:hypothetical protein